MGDPSWTSEKNIAWQSRLAENILRASSKETAAKSSAAPPTGVSDKRVGYTTWNANKRQEFFNALSGLGITIPNAPTASPTPGGVLPAGK